MKPPILFPPITDALIVNLRDQFDEVDETAEVVDRVPNPRPARFVRLIGVGGHRDNLVVRTSNVIGEAWGGDDNDAEDLAQLALAFLHATAGGVIEGITVYRVEEFGGPANLPDPISDQSRFTFQIAVSYRGSPL